MILDKQEEAKLAMTKAQTNLAKSLGEKLSEQGKVVANALSDSEGFTAKERYTLDLAQRFAFETGLSADESATAALKMVDRVTNHFED